MATTITQSVVSTVATPTVVNASTADTTTIINALNSLYEGLGVTVPSGGFNQNGVVFAPNGDGTSVSFVKWIS